MTQAARDKAYFVAQIKQAETPEDARKIYLKLSKEVHPDLNPELGKEPMQALNDAYETVMKSWDGRKYDAVGKNDETYEKQYDFDADFEKIFRDIIYWASTNPYTEEQELIGMWLWVKGSSKENCPFKAPKQVKNAEGKWEATEPDNRPSWMSLDGSDTPVRFQWSKSNRAWYMDLRQLVSRGYDYKRRTSAGLDFARGKYGSAKISKQESQALAAR
jgi:hypothetical protein